MDKIRQLVIIVISISLLCSCNDEHRFFSPDKVLVAENPAREDTLMGSQVIIDSSIVISSVRCLGDYNIAVGRKDGALVNVLSAENDSVIFQFGMIGHSKNEFADIPHTFYFGWDEQGDTLMYIQEDSYTKVLNLSRAIKSGHAFFEKEIKKDYALCDNQRFFLLPQNRAVIYLPVRYDEDAGDGMLQSPGVEIISGKKMKQVRLYPNLIDGESGIIELIYRAAFDISPDRTKCIEIPYCQDRFNIIHLNDGKAISVQTEDCMSFNDYQDIAKWKTFKDAIKQLKMYHLNYSVTDNYIFILYDGIHHVDEIDTLSESEYSANIRVYNWDGKFVASFFLGESIVWMDYNEKTHKMYGFDMEQRLFSYNLWSYLPD